MSIVMTSSNEAIEDMAALLIDTATKPHDLRCNWCGDEYEVVPLDMFEEGAPRTAHRREAREAIKRLIEHAAFDHSGRADILRVETEIWVVIK